MRSPPIPPAEMSSDQRSLHDDMTREIAQHLKGFVSKRADGALVGPFAPMLRWPQFGGPAFAYVKALGAHSTLPKPAHEVAILVTGAALSSRYELYAHEQVAAGAGLDDAKIATICAGQRPADLDDEEAAAYDVAATLAHGRALPESTYRRAVAAFGDDGTAELVYLVGGYCLVSMLLNAYDMSVPGRDESLPADEPRSGAG